MGAKTSTVYPHSVSYEVVVGYPPHKAWVEDYSQEGKHIHGVRIGGRTYSKLVHNFPVEFRDETIKVTLDFRETYSHYHRRRWRRTRIPDEKTAHELAKIIVDTHPQLQADVILKVSGSSVLRTYKGATE